MVGSAAFMEFLLQAVDDALLVPGEIVRVAIYDRIERDSKISRGKIPEKLELFHEALQRLLVVAARVMKKLIANNLHRRPDLNLNEHENWTLVDYVDHARKAHK